MVTVGRVGQCVEAPSTPEKRVGLIRWRDGTCKSGRWNGDHPWLALMKMCGWCNGNYGKGSLAQPQSK